MRKLMAVALVVFMMASLMAVTSFGSAYRGSDLDHSQTVKKADPADVVKDGIIGENEYVEFVIEDRSEETTPINVIYYDASVFQASLDMMKTIGFYFSWDDVHGLNFAIRYKPAAFFQVQSEGAGDPPEDYFLLNDGVAINFATEQEGTDGPQPLLYYAIGRRTDNGEYLRGYYGSNQLGLHANFNPVPGEDFVIVYDDATGFITVEWSIPLDNLFTTWGDGTEINFSIAAIAGEREEADSASPLAGAYANALGYKSWGNDQKQGGEHAQIVLSETSIKDSGGGDVPTTAPGSTEPGSTEPGSTEPGSTEPGQTTVPGQDPGTPGNPGTPGAPGTPGQQTPGGTAPRTGDPMMIIAAISALGACGAVVIKRRRG